MAYINFKEEKAAAIEQLINRRENNKKLFKELSKLDKISTIFPDEKYSFKTFNKRTMNTSKTENEENFLEVCDIDIVCSLFVKCKFYNIKFKGCKFIGCTFDECDFGGGGTIFENCSFIKEESESVPSLNKKDNLSCCFRKCNLFCKFVDSDISYLIIDSCIVEDTTFERTDMTSAIIIKSKLKTINMIDINFSGAKIVQSYIEDLEFNDKFKSIIDEKSFIDKIKPRANTRAEYEGLYMVYETIGNKFKENNLKNNFGEYYYLCKIMQRKTLKPLPKISSYIYWASSGYGERILYPVISSLAIILFFAIMYLIVGIDIDGEIVRYGFNVGVPQSFMGWINDFNESLNLSIGMFAGVGVNNSVPIQAAYMLSNVEMLLGVIMMGVGIGTITRKLIR